MATEANRIGELEQRAETPEEVPLAELLDQVEALLARYVVFNAKEAKLLKAQRTAVARTLRCAQASARGQPSLSAGVVPQGGK